MIGNHIEEQTDGNVNAKGKTLDGSESLTGGAIISDISVKDTPKAMIKDHNGAPAYINEIVSAK